MKKIILLISSCCFGFLADGQVSFSLSSSLGVGHNPNCVVAADVNGDGKMDLISADYSSGTISILINDGTGKFLFAGTNAVGTSPIAITAADLNGDGGMDLVTANSGAHSLSVLTNNGSGRFLLASSPGVGSNPWSVIAADLYGNGQLELISANADDSTLTVLTNNGSAGFAAAGLFTVAGSPHSVVAADVNGDGRLDLISANYGGNSISVLTNNGNGGFASAGLYTVTGSPFCVRAADLNGDGKIDLVTANYAGSSMTVLTNNGGGRFAIAGNLFVGSNPRAVAAVDVNGDGKVDLVSSDYNSSQLSVFTNNGSGGFVSAGTFPYGNHPNFLTTADVNGDGKVDMITADLEDSVSILTNGTPFPPASLPLITTQPTGQTNLAGSTVVFNVGATVPTGPLLFSYQWRFGGTNVLAATNSSLLLTNVSLSQAGNYSVVVANSAGSVTSSPAFLDLRFILVKVNGQPAAGIVTNVLSASVNISGGYANGFIFYTLDGSTPTTSSTFYTGQIILSNSAVVQVMSLSSDFSQMGFSAPVSVQVACPLNITTPGGGTVNVNGSPVSSGSNYISGTVVLLTPVSSSGWSFLGWQGSATGTNNPLSVMVNSTNTIQAIFGTIVTTNALGGNVVLNQSNPVPFGTIVTASALANPGNYLLTWAGALSGSNAPAILVVTNANPGVSALFTALPASKYSLSVIVNGNGFVTNNPRRNYYSSGDIVTLKAVTNAGSYFLGWSQDGSGLTNSLTVVMTTNKIVQANFGVLPTVTISPLSLTVLAGSNAVLSTTAAGPGPLGFQWQGSYGALAGATNPIFTITNIQPTNAGNFSVVVSNLYGSATSAVATITVTGVPTITNQPPALTQVISGQFVNLSVGAYGWPALAYQWRFNGTNLIGSTNNTVNLPNVFPVNAGIYTVVATNVYGSVTSNPSLVTVSLLPITAPARLPDGQFQFTFNTATGVLYEVEYSTNLTDWYPWLTVGGINQPLTLTDPTIVGTPQRFYRIILSPQ